MYKLYIDPAETVGLSYYNTPEDRSYFKKLCMIYDAKPLKANEDDFYSFLEGIFNAGRISGIRQERERRRASK